jgi:hypothetical protein
MLGHKQRSLLSVIDANSIVSKNGTRNNPKCQPRPEVPVVAASGVKGDCPTMATQLRFSVKFRAPRIDETKYLQILAGRMENHVKRAATAWLNAIVISVIPIWSGASRATFSKLASAVGQPLSLGGISSNTALISSQPRRWGPRAGYSQSEGFIEIEKTRFTFTYQTTLFHLVFNEEFDGNANPVAGRVFSQLKQPGPYGFRAIGQEAFQEFARTIRLPNPWNVARKTTSIRRGSI